MQSLLALVTSVAVGPALALAVAACGSSEPSAPGIVLLVVQTTGLPTDPDGYTASVDTQTRPIATNDSQAFVDIPSGQRQVVLEGVAANCTPSPALPASVSVVAGDTARFDIAVTCIATTGALTFQMATTGYDLDPDGFTLSVDGAGPHVLGTNASLTLSPLAPGAHAIQVSGAAPNCAITAPAEAAVVAGVNVQIPMTAVCQGPMRDVILFTDGHGHLMSIRPDGTALQAVLHDDMVIGGAVVSPDGMRVAALTTQTPGAATSILVVMRNDGGDMHPVVSTGVPIAQVAWTPDGRLAFAEGSLYNSWPDLCFIQSDGSDRQCVPVVAGHVTIGDFALSPDAGRVVYASGSFAFMDADGMNYSELATPWASYMPAWSPDGTRIAFQQVEDLDGDGALEAEIFVMNVDGSNRVRLTHNTVLDQYPNWSPDGSRLLYLSTGPNGGQELHVMDDDGANDRKLTKVGSDEHFGTWSPLP